MRGRGIGGRDARPSPAASTRPRSAWVAGAQFGGTSAALPRRRGERGCHAEGWPRRHGGADGRIAIWSEGKPQPDTVLQGHTAPVVALSVSPDGATLASAAWDHTVRLWRLADGAPRVLEGHTQNVNGVAFTPDGKSVVSVAYDLTLAHLAARWCRADDRHAAVAALARSASRRMARSSRRARTALCISSTARAP